MQNKKIYMICFSLLLGINSILEAQTVTFKRSDFVYTLTPCNKRRALSTIDIFKESKLYYHFDIYNFDYNNVIADTIIVDGTNENFKKIYNGYSYGVFKYGYLQINIIMYANSKTGMYSMIQLADVNLGGGIVTGQDLRKLFERSISHVDNK